MNIELLEKVKKAIADESKFFDMSMFFVNNNDASGQDCGTAACIAGHALSIDVDDAKKRVADYFNFVYPQNGNPLHSFAAEPFGHDFDEAARIKLGLTEDEAEWLFYAEWVHGGIANATRGYAIAAIDYLIAGNSVLDEQSYDGFVKLFGEE